MTPQEILAALSGPLRQVPEEALHEALAQREALTDPLLDALRGFVARAQDPAVFGEDEEDTLPVMAMYLLAQFREARAFPSFEALCRLPEPVSGEWLGDMLTQDFARFLASTCEGQPQALQRLAGDESLDLYARWTALDALLILVVEGAWPREAMIAWLGELWPRWRTGGGTTDFMPLALLVCDLRAASLLPLVREAYAARGVDAEELSLDEVEQSCAAPAETFREDLIAPHRCVEDAAQRMSWQARFHDDFEDDPPSPAPEPYVRLEPRIGRNDPCPCGSGRKYKKCCLQPGPEPGDLAVRS
jgi:hypothetical protein